MTSALERLEAVRDNDAWDALMRDREARRELLGLLSSELGTGPLDLPRDGSALVGLGEHEVVKAMSAVDAELLAVERTCLTHLHGKLPIDVPELVDAGVWRGLPYVRMRRLQGERLADVEVAAADLPDLGRQLGEALAALHATDAPADLPRVEWDTWRTERLGSLLERQRARSCPEGLLDGLLDVLGSIDTDAGRQGWLHTEVMPEHLFARRTHAGWRLSGLIDFEPSWMAPVHYEYASVGLFFARGRPGVLRAVLDGAGEDVAPERLFAMACLHRYANLRWYHEVLGGPPDPRTAAERWFADLSDAPGA
ncbi:MAG: phosphotransferase [Alphaproteobacteria bacterium]|nr:phosphotransferase [Alphaproteobacteria bacterium]